MLLLSFLMEVSVFLAPPSVFDLFFYSVPVSHPLSPFCLSGLRSENRRQIETGKLLSLTSPQEMQRWVPVNGSEFYFE